MDDRLSRTSYLVYKEFRDSPISLLVSGTAKAVEGNYSRFAVTALVVYETAEAVITNERL